MRYLIGSRAKLPTWLKIMLGTIPIILLIYSYSYYSDLRHQEDEFDKKMPSFEQMYQGTIIAFTRPSRSTGEPIAMTDIRMSVSIVIKGVAIVLVVSIITGLFIGTFPILEALFMPIINVVSMIPPAAVVPLLFLAFAPGEVLSLVIIFIFIFFVMTKDIVNQLKKIPSNLSVLLYTKGASELEIVKANYKMIIPGILESLKVNLPMIWVGLYFSETLGVQAGIGFRTFVLRKFEAYDIILPYILIVTLISMLMYYTLDLLVKYRYPWYHNGD